VQNASKFIILVIFVNISARQCICARLDAYNYSPKIENLLKIQDFCKFPRILWPPWAVWRAPHDNQEKASET